MANKENVSLRANWFIVVFSIMLLSCAMLDDTSGGGGENTYCQISATKAVVNEWYSGDVTVYSTYIDNVEYSSSVGGNIPPGLSWDYDYGVLSGTPTETGFYTVKIYYRDFDKGTSNDPDKAQDFWYSHSFEIEVSRFKQPESGGSGYVTVSNKTDAGIWVYVDGIEKGWVNPNGSKQFTIRAGLRAFTATNIAGDWSEEAVYEVESGTSYEVEFDFR